MLKTYRSLRSLYGVHVKNTLFQSPQKNTRICQVVLNSTGAAMAEVDGNTILAQALKKQVSYFYIIDFLVDKNLNT